MSWVFYTCSPFYVTPLSKMDKVEAHITHTHTHWALESLDLPKNNSFSLHLKMIVLPPRIFGAKMVLWVQMFIDFVDVEIVWHTKLFGKISTSTKSINIILESLNTSTWTPQDKYHTSLENLYFYHSGKFGMFSFTNPWWLPITHMLVVSTSCDLHRIDESQYFCEL